MRFVLYLWCASPRGPGAGFAVRTRNSAGLNFLFWVAVQELKLSYQKLVSPYNAESHEKMENDMETGGIWGFKELRLSYHTGYKHIYIYICIYSQICFPHYSNLN